MITHPNCNEWEIKVTKLEEENKKLIEIQVALNEEMAALEKENECLKDILYNKLDDLSEKEIFFLNKGNNIAPSFWVYCIGKLFWNLSKAVFFLGVGFFTVFGIISLVAKL